jgi:ABC-type multidrug transport system ATPase subunit
MTFIMGPSGAGKTTLLDAFAGRISGGKLSGHYKVNGCTEYSNRGSSG